MGAFEAQTSQGSRLFGEMLRTLPLAAAVFDREMRYVAHTRHWFSTHGRSEAEFVGRFHDGVFPGPADLSELRRQCLDGATEERVFDVVSDGELRHVRWTASPWGEADGRIDGIIVYAENITEQLSTHRRLRERESLIRDLFEKSPIGLNLCRMDGLWLESNRTFCDIIGYTQAEADGGLTYWQLTPPNYAPEEAVQLEKLRTTGRYGPYEKEFIRKDGSLIPVRLHGFLVEREEQTYIWSLIEDLTAQRALEADLESERLKAIQASKLATIGEMAAGIAHELNNPLGIVDACSFALANARVREDPASMDDAVQSIRSAVDRAARIVRGLRKFTRQSANEPPVELVVSELVDDALSLCDARIGRDRIRLDLQIDRSARVSGHSIELAQVLVNLLNNAADAVRDQAEKWICITAVGLDSGSVRITVDDSGPRIPPEIAKDIFKAFFTTKKIGEGTGLGLSISRSIVERHRGALSYDADTPHTRFNLDIPRFPS